MRSERKKFAIAELLMALVVLVSTVAFLRQQGEDEKPRVSVLVENPDDNGWAAFIYGLKTAAAENGVEYFMVSAEASMTFEEKLELMEEELHGGADALIVQPTADMDAETLKQRIESRVPVIFMEETDCGVYVAADNYALGQALGTEILADYSHNLSGKHVGIVRQSDNTEAGALREQGLRDALRGSKAEVSWSYVESAAQTKLSDFSKADIVAALDDAGTVLAAETAAAGDLHGAVVYGIGTSTEAAYYLDTGETECLLVPDEFARGYQSLTEIAKALKQAFYEPQEMSVGYYALRRDALFDEAGQRILYGMSQ